MQTEVTLLSHEKNKMMPLVATGRTPEIVVLNEITDEKVKYQMTLLICRI